MGASPAKNLFEYEEQAIIQETYSIGFGKGLSATNDSGIIKACGTEFTPSKLEDVARQLKLKLKNQGVHTRVEEAFSKIASVSELRVAAIMLGQGTLTTKLELLFNVFTQSQLEAAQLQAFLRTVCKVCLVVLGSLADDGQSSKAGRLRNEHYIAVCKQTEERWIQSLSLTTPASKEQFINYFANKPELTSPQFLRRHFFSFAKANPQGALSKTSTSSAFSKLRSTAAQQPQV